MIILFVDFKAAFDLVDRGKMVRAMRKKGVKKGLVKRCEEVLKGVKRITKGKGDIEKITMGERGSGRDEKGHKTGLSTKSCSSLFTLYAGGPRGEDEKRTMGRS